ncbi:hypothetical protein BGZ82_006322 [Podila clonocystis]|nr:hypothetical protein BGZ82_006322 [Podila clonocystis]
MFIRTVVFAAIAALSTSAAAGCRAVTFAVDIDFEHWKTWASLEVNSGYRGDTYWGPIGEWVPAADGGGEPVEKPYFYHRVLSYDKATDELKVQLWVESMGALGVFDFTKANKRPYRYTWEYWHCLNLFDARSNRSNRQPQHTSNNSTRIKNPQQNQAPPKVSNNTTTVILPVK